MFLSGLYNSTWINDLQIAEGELQLALECGSPKRALLLRWDVQTGPGHSGADQGGPHLVRSDKLEQVVDSYCIVVLYNQA